MKLELITSELSQYHVSQDTIKEFEGTILEDPTATSVNSTRLVAKYSYFVWKFFSLAGIDLSALSKGLSFSNKKPNFLAVLMGAELSKCFPKFLMKGSRSVYVFDAWPDSHQKIINFAQKNKVDNIFVSSSQVAKALSENLVNTQCFWVPEGVAPNHYKHHTPHQKNIDVLALGRRYEEHHEHIKAACAERGVSYLYERKKGEIVFPTRDAFIDGLARTKISICVPSNITHPERAGKVETMTVRYLQSMMSKCLILGHAPEEMIDLFGYNPVVEIDMKNPKKQLISVLDEFDLYQPLIEKNYQAVVNDHTWQNRWSQMKEIISEG